MAEFPLQDAIRGKDVELIRMPFELRPYPAPTLKPEGSYLKTAWQNSVYPMAASLGVEIRLPDVSPQPYTRLAFEGLEFAKDHGAADAYNLGVMRAFFQRSENIGEPEILARIAAEARLDGAAFHEALRNHTYADRVAELLRHAYDDMQITGVPLFVLGETRLSGVQSQRALERAIDNSVGQVPHKR